MKICKTQDINNNVYIVTIATSDFSEADTRLMADFGEPTLNVGGSFTGPPAFDLPDQNRLIRNESPFVQRFDVRDEVTPGDAEASAIVWGDEIITRIKAAIDALRANADTFSGEVCETY